MAVNESWSKDINFFLDDTLTSTDQEKSSNQDKKKWPQDMRSSREARAKRLKTARNMTCLSRRLFYELYGIPPGTLQNWESARFGGLSEKGAYIVLQALKAEGVNCSFEWLMYGIGPGPRLSKTKFASNHHDSQHQLYRIEKPEAENSRISKKETANKDLEIIIANISKELQAFRDNNTNSIDFVINDDSMLPRFIQGEYVAGNRLYDTEISQAIGKDCIVQTAQGERLVRRIRRGGTPNFYTLMATNPDTMVASPILYDVELACAAPIIWARRIS